MIEVREVSYSIKQSDGIEKDIISGIDLIINSGEKVGIFGANGSGKTTFVKLIAGLIESSQGEILVDGVNIRNDKFTSQLGKKIGFLFQNPDNQLVSINVERELALGLENYGTDSQIIRKKVDEYLAKFGFRDKRYRALHNLSGGEKHKLALASVLILEPEIIILDEPGAHLDQDSRRIYLEEINSLNANQSNTIIHITQEFDEIKEYDRILVFVNGAIARDCSPKELKDVSAFEKYKVKPPVSIMKRNLSLKNLKETLKSADNKEIEETCNESKKALKINKLGFGWKQSCSEMLIEDLNITMEYGKVYGLYGSMGCGKSTLAMIIAGLIKPNKGQVKVDGKKTSQSDLIDQVIYMFQMPERAMFANTVYEDIAFGPQNFGSRNKSLDEIVKESMHAVRLDYEKYKQRSPFNLSGGEARLAAIAGCLACGKSIIIFDEPTEELDYGGYINVRKIIHDLKQANKCVLVISHDIDFLFEISDSINIWHDKKMKTFQKGSLFDNTNYITENIPEICKYAQEFNLQEVFKNNGIYSFYDDIIIKLSKS